MAAKVEWLQYGSPKVDEWRPVTVAVDGQLASFSIHEADWRMYPTDEARNAMLIRQAQGLIAEYGDLREGRPIQACESQPLG